MAQDNQDQPSLLGFIAGLLAGAAAGVLLAPYTGKESRKLLTDRAGSLKKQANDTLGISGLPKVKSKKKKKGDTPDDSISGKKKKNKKGKKAKNKDS